jgi:uncharacterized protein YneF (UPF0154 family)
MGTQRCKLFFPFFTKVFLSAKLIYLFTGVAVDEVWMMVLSGLINGVMLFFGIFLGSKLSAKAMKREIQKVMDESNTLKLLVKILGKVDNALSGDLEGKASLFFEKAAELLGSEEARNFFRNLSLLIQQFTKPVQPSNEPLLKLPEARRVEG